MTARGGDLLSGRIVEIGGARPRFDGPAIDLKGRALETAHRGGVKLAYGTDLLGVMHRHQLREFAIRREVQSPADIIRAATVHAAALFRMAGEIGVVAPGARADLLVIDGDPLHDIGVLQDPARFLKAVVQDGMIRHDRLAEM